MLCNFLNSSSYTYWTLEDARVKENEHLENQNVILGPSNIFDFLNIHPFSPGGFRTFLVALAHCPPDSGGPDCSLQLWCIWQSLRSFMSSKSILGFIDSVSNLCLTCQPPKQLPLQHSHLQMKAFSSKFVNYELG